MKNDHYYYRLFQRADNCPSRILILLRWIQANGGETATKAEIEEILEEEQVFYAKGTLSQAWKLLESKGLVKFNRQHYYRTQSWHPVKLTAKGKQASQNYKITHRFWKNR